MTTTLYLTSTGGRNYYLFKLLGFGRAWIFSLCKCVLKNESQPWLNRSLQSTGWHPWSAKGGFLRTRLSESFMQFDQTDYGLPSAVGLKPSFWLDLKGLSPTNRKICCIYWIYWKWYHPLICPSNPSPTEGSQWSRDLRIHEILPNLSLMSMPCCLQLHRCHHWRHLFKRQVPSPMTIHGCIS